MPQRCMCPNFNWEYRMIAALQRRKLNMFKWREGMLSPRALVRRIPARVKFAAENWWSYILFSPECKELTSMLDPLLYRWGVPPVVIRCVHWTMQMWILQTWIKAQGLAIVTDYTVCMDYMDPDVHCPEKAVKLTHSFTHSQSLKTESCNDANVVSLMKREVVAIYDDVIKWKHFPRYWPFVRGIHWSLMDSPHKVQWRRALMFLWSAPELTVEQTIETSVIWDAIALIMTSL